MIKKTHSKFLIRSMALLTVASVSLILAPAGCSSTRGLGPSVQGPGSVEHEVKSDFSHIRIRRNENVRAMMFVRDSGEEVIETKIDLDKPQDLLVPYTQTMFASYLFRPEQKDVLIVGLGGGAMVRFLQHHDPQLNIDAVEIDPVVVRIADEYFGTRPNERTRIITEDAFRFFAETNRKYDVVYMDAFLKPSNDTDSTGVSLRLKTIEFYKDVQATLKPEGLVVFNLNSHSGMDEDINTIRSSFANMYIFDVPQRGNQIIVGSISPEAVEPAALAGIAKQLDARFSANFSFASIPGSLRR